MLDLTTTITIRFRLLLSGRIEVKRSLTKRRMGRNCTLRRKRILMLLLLPERQINDIHLYSHVVHELTLLFLIYRIHISFSIVSLCNIRGFAPSVRAPQCAPLGDSESLRSALVQTLRTSRDRRERERTDRDEIAKNKSLLSSVTSLSLFQLTSLLLPSSFYHKRSRRPQNL